jgi:DNA replication and repair protein RecF
MAENVAQAPRASMPMAALAVRRLRLTDFRGYARTELAVEPRPVVLSGPNGVGKTNLLEAISFLAPGRGLRGVRLAEIARAEVGAAEDGAAWAVAARLDTPRGPVEIGTGLAGAGGGAAERRLVRIDGAPARPGALADHVSMVWLTPAMDRLFVEAASERRRFLDRLVLSQDAGHATRLGAYDKAMRDRGRLLREGPWDTAWLGALEAAMGEQGVAIAAARRTAVARLNGALAMAEEGPFPQVALSAEDETGSWLEAQPAVEAEDRLRVALAAGRRRDAEAGRALTGPHRADLRAFYVAKGRDAARCSTGEQKAMLIAILLASARLQAAESEMTPILLLDEVAAHLDAARRAALFDAVCALGAQAWFTGTDPALFAALAGRAQHFHVADATITAA